MQIYPLIPFANDIFKLHIFQSTFCLYSIQCGCVIQIKNIWLHKRLSQSVRPWLLLIMPSYTYSPPFTASSVVGAVIRNCVTPTFKTTLEQLEEKSGKQKKNNIWETTLSLLIYTCLKPFNYLASMIKQNTISNVKSAVEPYWVNV